MDRIKNKKINEIYKSRYTLYEYCIILQKYTYIRKYCEYFITKKTLYSAEKYLEYCKQGNLEAVYYCIFVGQVNIDKKDEEKGRDAFYIACEKNDAEMLCMLIDIF